MKKILLYSSAIVFALIIIILLLIHQNSHISIEESTSDTAPISDVDLSISEIETSETETDSHIAGAQSLFTIDSWLKIWSVEKINGKPALIAENISDEDIKFALIRIKTMDSELTFNVSALFKNTKAFLLCNEEYSSDIEDEIVYWQSENKMVYSKAPGLNTDSVNVTVSNGAISVQNVSDSDISSEIRIYYKEMNNNLLNGSVTHRVKINSLNAGALTYIKVDGINNNNCKVIFTEYE